MCVHTWTCLISSQTASISPGKSGKIAPRAATPPPLRVCVSIDTERVGEGRWGECGESVGRVWGECAGVKFEGGLSAMSDIGINVMYKYTVHMYVQDQIQSECDGI